MSEHATLAHQRCWNHSGREAVARCPGCRRHFCRECITDFAGRLLCTTCVEKEAAGGRKRAGNLGVLLKPIQLLIGIFVLWFLFYTVGSLLLRIPSDFHSGEVWKSSIWDSFSEAAEEE